MAGAVVGAWWYMLPQDMHACAWACILAQPKLALIRSDKGSAAGRRASQQASSVCRAVSCHAQSGAGICIACALVCLEHVEGEKKRQEGQVAVLLLTWFQLLLLRRQLRVTGATSPRNRSHAAGKVQADVSFHVNNLSSLPPLIKHDISSSLLRSPSLSSSSLSCHPFSNPITTFASSAPAPAA